jgi:carbon monoxide dehydrogenase subunit G
MRGGTRVRNRGSGEGIGALKIDGNYTFAAPRERVYVMLRDPGLLKECIPGCQSLDLQDDGRYLMKVQAGIAAVRGTFTGHVQITDEVASQGYKLVVDGSGGPGFVKGEAVISLTDAEIGTQVTVAGDGQVGGMIAGVGQRVLLPAARMMMNQFFGCMQGKIEAAPR